MHINIYIFGVLLVLFSAERLAAHEFGNVCFRAIVVAMLHSCCGSCFMCLLSGFVIVVLVVRLVLAREQGYTSQLFLVQHLI